MSSKPMSSDKPSVPVVPRAMLVPFILITILFPLWGFANDITNPMVAAFKNILLLTNFESSLVQAAFYGGYALMAIPAAIFIKKFSYKKGIIIGLALYAIGCLLFIPSGWSLTFAPFLLAYLVMTCGLSFLETTANPYILSMGDERTATRRLNLAQAFNPMGSIVGMFVASMFILANLDGTSENSRRAMKAASDGVPVYSQLVAETAQSAKEIKQLATSESFANKRSSLKKAAKQSQDLAQRLELMSNPDISHAQALQRQLAEVPSTNRFVAAAEAVAVVLQLREEPPPSTAEVDRDTKFHGQTGLELALLLGAEIPLLRENPQFLEAVNSIRSVSAVSRQVAAKLNAFNDAGQADSAQLATLSSDLSLLTTQLDLAAAAMKNIPGEAFGLRKAEAQETFRKIQKSDLEIIVWPYALMGGILIVILVLFAWKLPHDISQEGDNQLHLGSTLKRLFQNGHYLWGVVAQTFYVGAQIMCWTFIIQYAELELGLSKATAQNCNILAMVIFVSSRFICTFILHYVKPGALLAVLALGGLALTAGTIFIHGYGGLYCLIGVSACMSLMFPTIYGIALDGLGDDAKLASAGLILAIGGGCLMPPLQGAIIDLPPINLGFMELASVRASFVLPLICFAVIAFYGFWSLRERKRLA